MRFDFSVARLITDAYKAQTDIYLRMPVSFEKEIASDGIKTLILLSGAFFTEGEMPFSCYGEKTDCIFFENAPDVLFADVRFMINSSFRDFITKNNYRRIVPVFSECALIGEYGYREAYSWIGEYRAEISHFCQVVPLFSSCIDNMEDFRKVFASDECVVIGEKTDISFNVFKTGSAKGKFYHTAAEAEKYAFRKITVFFNSRTELKAFGRFLDKRGTSYISVDGSISPNEYSLRLKKFSEGEVNILLATKSFIPSSLFCSSEIVILCGVPFTLSYIERITPVNTDTAVKIIYCEEDYRRNDRIIRSLSEALGNEDVYKKGAMHLSEIKKLLDTY